MSISKRRVGITLVAVPILCIMVLFGLRDCQRDLRAEETEYMWDAVRNGDLAGVEDLVGHGSADVNARRDGGLTPLMVAVKQNDISLARLLIALHADVSVRADDGSTALDLAKAYKRRKIVDLLTHSR